MVRTIFLTMTAGLAICSSLVGTPARAEASGPSTGTTAVLDRAGRYGPFATLRRANEVANYWRGKGYNARVVYLGTLEFRSYAVDVW